MFNIIDFIIIGIIIISLYRGWSKGLILTVGGLVSLIISWIVAKRYYKIAATYLIQNIQWVNDLKTDLIYKINNSFDSESQLISGINDGTFLEKLNIPKYFKTGINQLIIETDLARSNNLNEHFAEIIINALMNLLAFILLFIFILLLIKLVLLLIDYIFSIPILNGINKFGGMIFGFFVGNFIVFVLMAIVVILIPMGLDFGVGDYIEASKFGKLYYNNNVILYLINYYL